MYSDFLSINEQFKNSVNIEYDLMDYDKLAEYIPTEDICEVIKYYFDSIKDPKNNRSTILEGPYGKGKSYLVLTLIQLLNLDLKNKKVKAFLDKLKKVDKDLFEEFVEIKKKDFKLLPIVINSNYNHLQQALNIALKDALSRFDLDNLHPDTAYEICLRVIDQWEKDETVSKKAKDNCLSKVNDTLENIKQGLKNYDSVAFEKFTNVYNCIVNGLEFNPFVNDDVIKNYKDIAHKLNKHGYNGIFIVFDEFSKFIDADLEGLTNELKVLQDLAEVVSRSGSNGQMHLCCITHKSLESYYRNKKESIANAIRTVEGRFKELRFNRSLNQNYEIISYSIEKKAGFDDFYNDFEKNNKQFYSNLKLLDLFNEINEKTLYKGCFPLNPLTTYAVINISEKIAQNERTLFTFISDNDSNSLSTFIKNNNDGLFNVDKIYDYFSSLIEKNDDEDIRKLHYKVITNLSKTGVMLEKSIIKVVAIIKIINNGSFIQNTDVITKCLNADKNEVTKALNNLIDQKLLKKSAITETFDFAGASAKEIDVQIDSFVSSKGKINSLSLYLNELFDSNFVLPRKYNTKRKMTRYYREKYITDFELLKMNSFKQFYASEFSDGLIFRVINTGIDVNEIKAHFNEIKNNETTILKLNKEVIGENIIQEIYRIVGLKNLISKDKIDDLARGETEAMFADELSEMETYLNMLFNSKTTENLSYYQKNVTYTELLSKLMELQYPETPIINNEMINKESTISANYIKARNAVIDLYLRKKIDINQDNLNEYSVSSPENTVYISCKDRTSVEKRDVLEVIKKCLIKAENNKTNSSDMIAILKSKPYGIRNGVIPILIGMAINEMDINIIFYYENREIDLNASNIEKMVSNPSKYFFLTEKGSKEKSDYLNDLLKLFDLATTNSYRDDIKQAVEGLQKWFLSMPRIIRNVTEKDNYLNIDTKFIKVRDIFMAFNINEYAAIFEKMPKIFNGDYMAAVNNIKKYKLKIDTVIIDFTNKLATIIKAEFDCKKDSSLYNAVDDWLVKTKVRDRILEDKEKSFVSLFDTKNYDDFSLINEISKNIVNVQLTDWEKDQTENIIKFINDFKSDIESRKFIEEVVSSNQKDIKNNINLELSPLATMISNNIEEALDEFGDSVSKEEKINILKNLINQML